MKATDIYVGVIIKMKIDLDSEVISDFNMELDKNGLPFVVVEISTSKDGDIRFKAESFSMKTKIGKKWRNQYGYGENNSEVIYSLEGEIKEGEELELVNFNSWELTEQFGGWALLPKGGTVEA